MLKRNKLMKEINKTNVSLSSDSRVILLHLVRDITYEKDFAKSSESDINQYVIDMIIDLVDDGVIDESEGFKIIRIVNIALRECRE